MVDLKIGLRHTGGDWNGVDHLRFDGREVVEKCTLKLPEPEVLKKSAYQISITNQTFNELIYIFFRANASIMHFLLRITTRCLLMWCFFFGN